MPGSVVPYERFVEIRQRRTRVVAELALPPGSMRDEDPRDAPPVTIDCEAVIDTDCGTRTQTVVAMRRKNPSA
jgi:hypothetical protein